LGRGGGRDELEFGGGAGYGESGGKPPHSTLAVEPGRGGWGGGGGRDELEFGGGAGYGESGGKPPHSTLAVEHGRGDFSNAE